MREVSSDWVARTNGPLGADEAVQLKEWLAADPRHAVAFAEAEATWRILNRPRRAGSAEPVLQALATAERRRLHRFRLRAFAAATASAAAALAFVMFPPGPRALSPRALSPTVVFSPDRQLLPDGSTAELNAGAEISVTYSAEVRSIRLVKGEVLFTVAANAARPFVVTVGDLEVRALGTAFTVRSKPLGVDVLVTHGRVAIEKTASSPEGEGSPKSGSRALEITAGSKAAIQLDEVADSEWTVQTLGADEIQAALAWREKRFEFTETPLGEAVDLFNRQNHLELALADPSLRGRRITGIFWSDDPEGFVRLLETGLRMKAERSGDRVVLSNR